MVHTLPPWTSKWRMATIFGQIDQGEMAARLNSINTFDRRGDTVWMDDFESANLNWNTDLDGTAASAILTSKDVYRGGQSCRLYTGLVLNAYAGISHYFDLPVQTRVGLEFSITGQYANSTLELQIYLYDGTNYSKAAIEYVGSDKELFYNDDGDIYQTLGATAPFGITPRFYTTVKLVVDYATNKYVRFIKGNRTYDLSSYDMYTFGSGTDPLMIVRIRLTSTNTTANYCYIDDVIITQNEP